MNGVVCTRTIQNGVFPEYSYYYSGVVEPIGHETVAHFERDCVLCEVLGSGAAFTTKTEAIVQATNPAGLEHPVSVAISG
jgi:hypothetical protein